MTVQTWPLRVAGPDVAATITSVVRRADFSESGVCGPLRIDRLDAVDQPVFKTLVDRLAGTGALEVLARLFLFGEALDRDHVLEHLTTDELEAFLSADLMRVWDGGPTPGPTQLYSPVRVVPMHVDHPAPVDLLVAGDRGDHPDGSRFQLFSDIVFPGNNPLTRQFLRLLPTTRPARVLDLCTGTGVAALVMSALGVPSTAADIADRSTHFARFNAWLNGCDDTMTVVSGDLYEPVHGRVDCILAHPPYVPALAQEVTYRDGGEAGDAIVRRIVAGAPDHLGVGGTFHLLCLGMDTAEGLFEERVRQWLGPAGDQFDVVFAVDSTNPPELIATRLIDRSGGSLKDLIRWRGLFDRLQVKEFVYGAVMGRRFAEGPGGEPFTRRVLMTDATTASGFEWLFRWFDEARQPGMIARLIDGSWRVPADLKLDVQHRVDNGVFVPATYVLENGGRPFRARLTTEAWVAALMCSFESAPTARSAFASAKAAGRVPDDFDEARLSRLLGFLVERGCLVPAA